MTDTFSCLLFPKLFCPKQLSLVAKNPYRPFFHVWDWSILPLLENELYKRVFNVPYTTGHSSILIFQKKWSHVISRDVLESFHVYQISIRFHPLCQSHSKETIFIWKNPVKRQKNKLQFNQNCSTKGVVDQPFVLSGQKKVSHAFVWSPTSALTAIYYDIHNYVFFPNWPSPRFRIHVKNIIKAWSGSVVAIIDCKTVRIFAYLSTREQSNKRNALLISLLILRKKPTVLQSMAIKEYAESVA